MWTWLDQLKILLPDNIMAIDENDNDPFRLESSVCVVKSAVLTATDLSLGFSLCDIADSVIVYRPTLQKLLPMLVQGRRKFMQLDQIDHFIVWRGTDAMSFVSRIAFTFRKVTAVLVLDVSDDDDAMPSFQRSALNHFVGILIEVLTLSCFENYLRLDPSDLWLDQLEFILESQRPKIFPFTKTVLQHFPHFHQKSQAESLLIQRECRSMLSNLLESTSESEIHTFLVKIDEMSKESMRLE